MRVLVTGASGLIGRHATTVLLESGHQVRTFQRSRPDTPDAKHVVGDVETDQAELIQAARTCQAVVHLAGRGDVGESRRDPLGYARLNATGALHALEAARLTDAAFVLASTQRVYALRPEPRREDDACLDPDSPYGYAKWVAELWCRMISQTYGLPTTVLRFFSVYGPGQQPNGGSGVVAIFAAAALAGQPLCVQSAGRRDFTDARDAAHAIRLALERQRPDQLHRVYNIATGVGTTFRELAELVREVAGSDSTIDVSAASEPAGRDLVADVRRAEAELGFRAGVPLRAGLQRYVEWLRQA